MRIPFIKINKFKSAIGFDIKNGQLKIAILTEKKEEKGSIIFKTIELTDKLVENDEPKDVQAIKSTLKKQIDKLKIYKNATLNFAVPDSFVYTNLITLDKSISEDEYNERIRKKLEVLVPVFPESLVYFYKKIDCKNELPFKKEDEEIFTVFSTEKKLIEKWKEIFSYGEEECNIYPESLALSNILHIGPDYNSCYVEVGNDFTKIFYFYGKEIISTDFFLQKKPFRAEEKIDLVKKLTHSIRTFETSFFPLEKIFINNDSLRKELKQEFSFKIEIAKSENDISKPEFYGATGAAMAGLNKIKAGFDISVNNGMKMEKFSFMPPLWKKIKTYHKSIIVIFIFCILISSLAYLVSNRIQQKNFITLEIAIPIVDQKMNAEGNYVNYRVKTVTIKEAMTVDQAIQKSKLIAATGVNADEIIWDEPLNKKQFGEKNIFPLNIEWILFDYKSVERLINKYVFEAGGKEALVSCDYKEISPGPKKDVYTLLSDCTLPYRSIDENNLSKINKIIKFP